MAWAAAKQTKMFRFYRAGELHRMASHLGLKGIVGPELVGHFFYKIQNSTMKGEEIVEAWIASLDEIRDCHKKLYARFMRGEAEFFERVLRAIILTSVGVDEGGVEHILNAKKRLESIAQAENSGVGKLLRRKAP